MTNLFNSLNRKVIEYKWFILFFFIFLFFQLQQFSGFSWDLIVYQLQGQWFCGNQIYFEWLRPPLPGVVNCIFGANNLSVLFSIALASVLYFIAIIFTYLKEKGFPDRFLVAGFSFLFPIILLQSNAGGDLFALSFLLLAFAMDSPLKKGLFFGLATLARYNFFLYGLILLYKEKPKNLVKIFVPVILLWLPWLFYNYSETGDPFFSVKESIFLNIQQKGLFGSFDLLSIAVIVFFLISLALNKRSEIFKKYNLAAIFASIQFLFSGIKELRFLNLLVPAQAINISKTTNPNIKKFLSGLIVLLFLFSAFNLFYYPPSNPDIPEGEFLNECKVMSDQWVYFYPKGIVAEPLNPKSDLDSLLEKGVVLVVFNESAFNLPENGVYTILKPEKCEVQKKNFVLKINP
tara:strand:+ start:3541 stop:4752 length:1212 start_codon:yes stop_codon:yes gene_type:complete